MTNEVFDLIDIGDAHVHFRQNKRMKDGVEQKTKLLDFAVPMTATWASFALPMPNTVPSIRTGSEALIYEGQIGRIGAPMHIIKCIKAVEGFTIPKTIRSAKAAGVDAIKVYFEGMTTNADKGDAVSWQGFFDMLDVWRECEAQDIVVCIHAEKPGVFSLRREYEAIEIVTWLSKKCPNLRICVEHVTDRRMVDAIKHLPPNVRCTVTTHHLWGDLDMVIGGNLNVHAFCKPIAKEPADRLALIDAVLSGDPKFMFGSDSAPHPLDDKCHEGCAGCFTGPYSPLMVAHIFEKAGVDDIRFAMQKFMGDFAQDFYRVPPSGKRIRLIRREYTIPTILHTSAQVPVVPFMAGQKLNWMYS